MEKTKIYWCDSTWNPVTGCLHGCEYCYARNIAHRFGGWTWIVDGEADTLHDTVLKSDSPIRELDEPLNIWREHGKTGKMPKAPYPYDFIPTFHRYKLGEPQKWKKGRNVFVCSMVDLFGDWVPDEWIAEVFKACGKAPQHNYLFLTKNPARYVELINNSILGKTGSNMWFGYTYTGKDSRQWWNPDYNIFVSAEPILEPIEVPRCKWLIVGAETGRRKEKVVPERRWIEAIVSACEDSGIPLFMKDSLIPIVGAENMRREYPGEMSP